MIGVIGEKVAQWFERRWERKSTIVIVLLLISVVFVWKFTDSSLSDLSLIELVFILVLLLIVFLIWLKSTAIPKAPRNRVGVAVAVTCEGDKEKQKIAADFISELRNFLSQNKGAVLFHLVEIPEYYAKSITNHESAARIRLRSRCHLIIYGSAKIRNIQGSDKHILRLNMQVGHRPIPRQISQRLSREMSEIFPRLLHIDSQNDLFGFEFTSEWINCVARYIVGIVASFSGDLDRSEALFLNLYENRHFQTSPLPHINKLRHRVPIWLGKIYAHRASIAYEKWRKDREMSHIDEMWSYLIRLRSFSPENYAGRLLTSIYYFVKQRNINAAIREVRKCRNIRDATWEYSYAFLLAYSGQMTKARRMYRSAFRHHYDRVDVPIQAEEFMHWVLEVESDKIQLLFCLGLLNWYAKGDLRKAIEDLEQFVASENSNKAFPEEVRLANCYLGTLQSELNKGNGGR